VASVVGTMIFLVVFMLALGSLTYAAGLQEQTSQSIQQEEANAAARGLESLAFGVGQDGLSASDAGSGTLVLSYLVLRFPNGTIYALSVDASVPMEGNVSVAQLVPHGICSPGTATCASKYDQILAGNPRGSSIGLVTSMGNTYWYSSSGDAAVWSEAVFTSSGNWFVPPGTAAVYVVCIGGGGGGGGSGSATYETGVSGTGGGAGGGVGSLAQGFEELDGTSSVAVVVGPGGTGGAAGGFGSSGGAGGDGGASSFGRFLICGGGEGGGGSYYNINAGRGASCAPSAAPFGGSGDGISGGMATNSGVPANAIQQTIYGGGGGGGSDSYTPPGEGSASDSLTSGTIYTGLPGASGPCAFGGGGGSASPFGDGGTGGSGATGCGTGQGGGSPAPDTGAGGGGAGGSYSTSVACGSSAGAPGGSGGSGEVIVYYVV
jgi:hypothetical protein